MQLSNFTRSYGLVTRTFLEFSYLAVASDEMFYSRSMETHAFDFRCQMMFASSAPTHTKIHVL